MTRKGQQVYCSNCGKKITTIYADSNLEKLNRFCQNCNAEYKRNRIHNKIKEELNRK